MILVIIFGIIGIMLVAGGLSCIIKDKDDDGFAGVFVGGLMLVAISVPCIHVNTEMAKLAKRNEINAKIEYLNAEYTRLTDSPMKETIDYNMYAGYNQDVEAFKYKLLTAQAAKRNPWVSWFTSPVWLEYDVNCVSYIN